MIEETKHDLENRWESFAKHYGIQDYRTKLMDYEGGKALYVEVRAGEISAPFNTPEETTRGFKNYGLQLLEPADALGVYKTFHLIRAD